jgi:hypothetical protein
MNQSIPFHEQQLLVRGVPDERWCDMVEGLETLNLQRQETASTRLRLTMIRWKFVSPISGFPEGTFRENGIHAWSFIKGFGERQG